VSSSQPARSPAKARACVQAPFHSFRAAHSLDLTNRLRCVSLDQLPPPPPTSNEGASRPVTAGGETMAYSHMIELGHDEVDPSAGQSPFSPGSLSGSTTRRPMAFMGKSSTLSLVIETHALVAEQKPPQRTSSGQSACLAQTRRLTDLSAVSRSRRNTERCARKETRLWPASAVGGRVVHRRSPTR
jgi:hypothetical protein